jgi:hypothetical protein
MIEVVQGGLTDDSKFLDPIAHEPTNRTGLRHRNGTISIARDGVGTGTAGAFFICIGDQPELDFGGKRNPDGQGFAAFGHVTSGTKLIREIGALKTPRTSRVFRRGIDCLAGPNIGRVGCEGALQERFWCICGQQSALGRRRVAHRCTGVRYRTSVVTASTAPFV